MFSIYVAEVFGAELFALARRTRKVRAARFFLNWLFKQRDGSLTEIRKQIKCHFFEDFELIFSGKLQRLEKTRYRARRRRWRRVEGAFLKVIAKDEN